VALHHPRRRLRPTNAAKNARKLISEDKADMLMGSNGVPSAVQMAQAAAEAKNPEMVLTPAALSGNTRTGRSSCRRPPSS